MYKVYYVYRYIMQVTFAREKVQWPSTTGRMSRRAAYKGHRMQSKSFHQFENGQERKEKKERKRERGKPGIVYQRFTIMSIRHTEGFISTMPLTKYRGRAILLGIF